MVIKITLFNHVKALWLAIFTTCLYIGVCSLFNFEKSVTIVGLCYYILFVVPSFILHISYYLRNRGIVCVLSPESIAIEKDGEIQNIILFNDIQEIIVYKSASMDTRGIPITPMEAYFFVRVFDVAGKKYDLTCLMDTNIDKSKAIMRGVKIFREKGFFNI